LAKSRSVEFVGNELSVPGQQRIRLLHAFWLGEITIRHRHVEPHSELLWKSEMRPRSDKSGDGVGRPSCRSSLLGDAGAKFLVETGDPNRTMKNSLNYVSTCLSVVGTRRFGHDQTALIELWQVIKE
jgi:hypothetical protein